MKKLFMAVAVACAMTLMPAVFAAAPAMAQGVNTEMLPQMEAEVEALVMANADDAAAFEQAIEDYIVASDDPVTAGQAVINVLTNPKDDAVRLLLAENPALKEAGGRGLGAAIAVLGLTNPEAAAILQALVEASGDPVLEAAVLEGTETRTASLRAQGTPVVFRAGAGDSTPESPASPN